MTSAPAVRLPARAPLLAGLAAATAMAAVYLGVLTAANGWAHAAGQVTADAVLLVPLWIAFGVQIGLLVRLRQAHRGTRGTTAAGGASAGVSLVGMLACCAHHAVDLLPVVGVTALAGVLGAWQRPLMIAGLVISLAGVAWLTRAVRRAPTHPIPSTDPERSESVCVH